MHVQWILDLKCVPTNVARNKNHFPFHRGIGYSLKNILKPCVQRLTDIGKCRYDLGQADLAVAGFNELSVINLRRLFANNGSTFMDMQKQIVEKSPPKRKLTIDTIFWFTLHTSFSKFLLVIKQLIIILLLIFWSPVKFFDTSLNKLDFIQFLFDLDQILLLWFPIQILTPII